MSMYQFLTVCVYSGEHTFLPPQTTSPPKKPPEPAQPKPTTPDQLAPEAPPPKAPVDVPISDKGEKHRA